MKERPIEHSFELIERNGTGGSGDQPTFAIDDKGGGCAKQTAELPRDLAVLVPHHFEWHGVLGQVAIDEIRTVVGHGHGNHLKSPGSVAFEGSDQHIAHVDERIRELNHLKKKLGALRVRC